MDFSKVSVITWKYSDGSATGLLGVYCNQEEAKKIIQLLNDHGDSCKYFELHENIDVIGVGKHILTR